MYKKLLGIALCIIMTLIILATGCETVQTRINQLKVNHKVWTSLPKNRKILRLHFGTTYTPMNETRED